MKLFLKIIVGIFAFFGLLVLGVVVATTLSNRPGPTAEPLAALTSQGLEDAITGLAAERKLVGIAAKVMVGDTIIAEADTGWRTKDESDPILVSDLFHIGSIGKSMSATAIATLVEDGVMTWDDRLGDRLTDIPMDADWRDVTLAQLLTHTASAPRAPITAMMNSVSEDERLAEVRRETAATMLADPPTVEPGTAFAYSNEGFMLASLMAEEATGESWETIIRMQVAQPLGLSTLGFGAPKGDVPWGHRKLAGVKMALDPAENADNPPWMAAAGTMHISLDDLLTYGRAHLDAGQSEIALLSPATFDRLHMPVLNDYAYGWVVQSRDFGEGNEPVIWHNGSNTMWYAVLVLLPERDAAIVIATNDGSHLNLTQQKFDELAAQIAKAIVARG